MEKFDSITHFIQTGGFEYRIFDMGRKVQAVSKEYFKQLENQQEQYPHPFQQKAWLALLIWEKGEEANATIWFLHFPVDELGYLKQEARDAFLIELLEQAGKNIFAKQKGEKVLDELNESPFAFKPQQDRLAVIHALATKSLNLSPSQYYQPTREYLTGDSGGYDQWQFLGLQGMADVVVRLGESDNKSLLVNAMGNLPEVPLENFALLLENIQPEEELTRQLIALAQKEVSKELPNIKLVSALTRALSGAEPVKLRKEFFLYLLSSQNNGINKEVEVLVALSGRAWVDLEDVELLVAFVENLATQNQIAFNAVIVDLMMLPGMKEKVLNVMRRPERSAELAEKLSELMKILRA